MADSVKTIINLKNGVIEIDNSNADSLIIKLKSKEQKYMINELRDTIYLMTSADYKDRLKAEYYQTKIRYNSLHKMIVKYEADKLDFTPSCPLELLQEQASCMGNYLHKLEIRAEIENIEL